MPSTCFTILFYLCVTILLVSIPTLKHWKVLRTLDQEEVSSTLIKLTNDAKLRGAGRMNTRTALFSGTPNTNAIHLAWWTKGCCELILYSQCRVCEQEKRAEFNIISSLTSSAWSTAFCPGYINTIRLLTGDTERKAAKIIRKMEA